jgi:hypothetical protein
MQVFGNYVCKAVLLGTTRFSKRFAKIEQQLLSLTSSHGQLEPSDGMAAQASVTGSVGSLGRRKATSSCGDVRSVGHYRSARKCCSSGGPGPNRLRCRSLEQLLLWRLL